MKGTPGCGPCPFPCEGCSVLEMMTALELQLMLNALEWKPTGAQDHYEGERSSIPYATHEAVLHIGSKTLRCFQLSNGQRVFDADDVEMFFGIERRL